MRAFLLHLLPLLGTASAAAYGEIVDAGHAGIANSFFGGDASSGGLDGGNRQADPGDAPLPGACPGETRECEYGGGTLAYRDPDYGCEFKKCASEAAEEDKELCLGITEGCGACTRAGCQWYDFGETGLCWAGCDWNECGKTTCGAPPVCRADVGDCGGGIYVTRDPARGCAFEECPTGTPGASGYFSNWGPPPAPGSVPPLPEATETPPPGRPGLEQQANRCFKDLKDCGDGTFLRRDPNNGCGFPLCPVRAEPTSRPAQAVPTPAPGSPFWGQEEKTPQEEKKPAPAPAPAPASNIAEVIRCRSDALACKDGTSVWRDPRNGCDFPACPVRPAGTPSVTILGPAEKGCDFCYDEGEASGAGGLLWSARAASVLAAGLGWQIWNVLAY